MKSNHPKIRQLLRDNPDGLTVNDISFAIEVGPDSVHTSLRHMPDAYIDRWIRQPRRGAPMAVWCVVEVTPDCPKPNDID